MNNFYQPQIPSYQQPYNARMNQNGITWVQGIEGAKAFQLMPNSNTLLMDSENDGIFYIKICDNVGMCNLRTFKYEETTEFSKNNRNFIDTSQFITRDEVNSMIEEKLNGGQFNGKSTLRSAKSNSNADDKQSTSNAND